MNVSNIQNILERALLYDVPFSDALYADELNDFVGEIKESLKKDSDDAILCIIVNENSAAMFMYERNGEFYINANAKQRLSKAWQSNYKHNISLHLPTFSQHLASGNLAVAGVKYI